MLIWAWMTASAADVEAIVASELARAWPVLQAEAEPPHYAAVAVNDWRWVDVVSHDGALVRSELSEGRLLDVDLRVGTPQLDSTHTLRGPSAWDDDEREAVEVAYGDGADVDLAAALWTTLDDRYRAERERIVLLRSTQAVRVEEEHPAPDFEVRAPVVARTSAEPLSIALEPWETRLTALSARLLAGREVLGALASLSGGQSVWTFVDTEGSRIVHTGTRLRITLQAWSVADDGDRIDRTWMIDVHDPSRLPEEATLNAAVDALIAEVAAIRSAPWATPYTGPVLLSGRAAGVFVHEVMGHRVEGHRQKRDEEGKTFLDYVGKPVLPPFIDVVDDPTRERWGSTDLNGYYTFDDEGVAAQKAVLVEGGIFRGFLMSRSPLAGFPTSNGHGRRDAGAAPVARMGNTILSSRQMVSAAELRKRFVAELRSQGLAFGYRVEEIDGGFTLTGREMPNAFNVRASVIWRVYADGRPDERVRGLDLVGTPLAAFGNLIAAGGEVEVFNGFCGAESGWVPVSAVSPSLLFRRLEFQLKEKPSERPPLLPPPVAPDGAVEAAW